VEIGGVSGPVVSYIFRSDLSHQIISPKNSIISLVVILDHLSVLGKTFHFLAF